MKKIGLITFHASHNIGSMLQTYALQNILKNELNFDVEIIDFSNKEQQKMYSLFEENKSWKNLIKNTAITAFYPAFKSRFNDFENFIKDYMSLSKESYETLDELYGIEKNYDILVCGSDQIWNINCRDFDDAYYLPFAKNIKKVAYAPSLGGQNILDSTDNIKKYEEYLSDFYKVSVRENNGKKWLSEIVDDDVKIVPDPTMLLDSYDWDSIVGEREIEGDYIFYYGAAYYPNTHKILDQISKDLGMPIVTLDVKSWLFKGNFAKGFKLSKHTSPRDYLSLIKNAKLVLTTSFHGTIFSTIYKKDFWTLTFKDTNPDDDRVETLLNQLNMIERRMYLEDFKEHDLRKKVNYDGYDAKVADLKKVGMDYLKNALSND